MVEVAQKLESTVQLVIGLGFHSSAMNDVDRDALWGLDDDTELKLATESSDNFKTCDSDGNIITVSAEVFHCTVVFFFKEPAETMFDIDIRKNLYVNVEWRPCFNGLLST